ncbi:yadA domain protein [Burkholderia pseudomallei NAU20B-16]|nr:yadA domain protein [Burkholderia pseudomallei NAU20B-16]
MPAATFVTWRSAPGAPTLTTFERPPSDAFVPSATEFWPVETAPLPTAMPFVPVATGAT